MRSIYVIYHRPTDYPGSQYVMREHYVENNHRVSSSEIVYFSDTLEGIRRVLPPNLERRERTERDVRQIVEWWC